MRGRSGLVGLAAVVLVVLAGCGGTPSGQETATTTPTGSRPASTTTSAGSSTPSTVADPTTATPGGSRPSTAAPRTSRPATSPPRTSRPTTAAPGVPAALRGTDWTHLPTTRKVVALTFDGGASDAAVAAILHTLATENVRATFFLTGDFVRRYPSQARRIAAAGHVIGNHSNTHPNFTTLTNAAIRAQLSAAEAAIHTATGATAKPFFRFPYGARTATDIDVVNAAGYVPIRWTVDTLGWKGTSGGITVDTVLQRVLATARAGQIVLMHVGANPDDGTTLDAQALPRMIAALRARGYGFVTLRSML